MGQVVLLLLAALLGTWLVLLTAYARPLYALWREPVFLDPILVFESEDWGPAPLWHASILDELRRLLLGFSDAAGRRPVATLGLLLSIPRPGSASEYREWSLADPDFSPILDAVRAGRNEGVFAAQLHGQAHYWPAALIDAGRHDPRVAAWLAGEDTWRTEQLPDDLQSRWAPLVAGRPFEIPRNSIQDAAHDEAKAFERIFGAVPEVAVPTTFVWNEAAERGWRRAGVRFLVTPGRRIESRVALGRRDGRNLLTNGLRTEGLVVLVRDRYFEPYKGHTAAHGLAALEANTRLGRPTLLETHRANFLSEDLRRKTLAEMSALLSEAQRRYASLRFLSTAEIGHAIVAEAPEMIARSMLVRFRCWVQRIRELPRFWKLARASGMGLLLQTFAAAEVRPA
jgi:hypothetical protein